MGLFDSIRRVVGGTTESDEAATQPELVDTRDLDVSALRDRAESAAGEVGVLDFSLDSLSQFDDAIDAGYDEDLATSDRPGAYATDTVRFGCYLGEVLVRVHGGEWTRNPDWGVTISGPEGTATVAVFDVAERSITTGAVFAAVADRAAVEVGLDGGPADVDPSAGDDGPGDSADTGPSADDGPDATTADEDDTADDTQPAAAKPDALADDTADEPAAADPPADDPTADPQSDDTLTAERSSGDEPTAEVSDGDESTADTPDTATDDTGGGPDPAAADPTPSEPVDDAADVDDTELLIEEAEPESGDTSAARPDETPTEPETPTESGDPETAPGESPSASDGSESLFADDTDSGDETDRDASPSLFDDAAAGTGPTVDDAPSAEDGLALSEADSTPADGADRDDETTSGETDSTAGDGLRETYAEAAEELVSFWTEYDLDYTPESLERLDALVSEEWDDDRFDDADFGSDDSFDDRVFTSVSTELGGYFGEVLVRELDAEWSDETATDAVVVEGADGPLAIPVFKVAGTSITQQPVFARSYESLIEDLNADG